MSVLEKEQSEIPAVQLYPLGDAAVVVQFGSEISEQTHQKIRAFSSYLQQHPFPGQFRPRTIPVPLLHAGSHYSLLRE